MPLAKMDAFLHEFISNASDAPELDEYYTTGIMSPIGCFHRGCLSGRVLHDGHYESD